MARVLVQCRIHGGYFRPGWTVDGSAMERVDEGSVVSLPESEVARLVSDFGAAAWSRLPAPGEASPTPAVQRDIAALSVRDLLPAIRAGEFDDSLDLLASDARGTVATAAKTRARTIARG